MRGLTSNGLITIYLHYDFSNGGHYKMITASNLYTGTYKADHEKMSSNDRFGINHNTT